MRIVLYTAISLFFTTKLCAQEAPLVWDESSVVDDWQRAVRDFRRDHNFGILLGQTKTRWKGSVENSLIDTESDATEITLQYSFHIPWSRGFGYSLGTSASVLLGDQGANNIQTHYRATLPGLELGLVWNLSDRFRLNFGAGYGWERVDGLKIDGREGRVSITEESISAKLSVDYFYKLTWAVRVEYEGTRFPKNASASYDLEKSIMRTRVGLIKHLL
ncbi:MAG: hypothetical protein H7318_18640 [Oligoflexus sp.]|nr:hypothetical protein [Oligoflexus sp.]